MFAAAAVGVFHVQNINPHLCVTVSIVACAKCTFSMLCSGVTWHRCTFWWHESEELRHSTKATEMSQPSFLQQVKPQKINPLEERRVAPIEKVIQHSPMISNRCIKFYLGEELFHGTCWENMNQAIIEPGKKEPCGAVLSTMLVSKWMESIEKKKENQFLMIFRGRFPNLVRILQP